MTLPEIVAALEQRVWPTWPDRDLSNQERLMRNAAGILKGAHAALELYLKTYCDTQTQPTPAQEASVQMAVRGALKGE